MEKRLLLAFLLSFIVLTFWSWIGTKFFKSSKQPFNSQLSENQSDTPKPDLIKIGISDMPEKITLPEESIESIENEKLKVEFSNIGGAIKSIHIKDYNASLPIYKILNIAGLESAVFKFNKTSENNLALVYQDENVIIKKEFVIYDDYSIHSHIELTPKGFNLMSKIPQLNIDYFTLDVSRLDVNKNVNSDKTLYEYALSINGIIQRKENAYKFSEKEEIKKIGNLDWIGFRDRYFCFLIKPNFKSAEVNTDYISEHVLKFFFGLSPNFSSISQSFDFIVYCGPQELNLLKKLSLDFDKFLNFSNWAILDSIAKAIYTSINLLYKLVPNWGVCIILISVTIYFAMFPLTLKGMTSMKRMQVIQPQIAKLKEQYKNNPQRLNQEILELYKEHKINPLGGCLPFLLQMPVFVSLYQVLWRSIAFKGANFLWIKDLSEPDRLLIFPFSLPVIGNELNILPILMSFVMAFQQKLSSKNMMAVDPAQIAQQKMMLFFLPIFIGFLFYKFSSGLSLYFTTFYILSTFTQWKMSKINK